MLEDNLFAEISGNDLSALIIEIKGQKKGLSIIKKIAIYNRYSPTSKQIHSLDDLLNISIQNLRSTKSMGDGWKLIDQFNSEFQAQTFEKQIEICRKVVPEISNLPQGYLSISLVDIDEQFIPSKIRSKLKRNGLISIRDAITNRNCMLSLPASHIVFTSFVESLIQKHHEISLDYLHRKNGKNLIDTGSEEVINEMLSWFRFTVLEYLKIIGDRDELFLKHNFGLEGSKKYHKRKMGGLFGVTRERVRQIISDHLQILRTILIGESLPDRFVRRFKYKPTLATTLIVEFREFFDAIQQYPVISQSMIAQILEQDFSSTFSSENQDYLEMLLSIADLEKVPLHRGLGGITGSSRFSNDIFYVPISTKRDVDSFLIIANELYTLLGESAFPISELDLLMELSSRISTSIKDREHIHSIIEAVPEFEVLTEGESSLSKDISYQLRFDRLGSWALRLDRILYEVGEKQSIDELVDLARQKYLEYDIPKEVKYISVRSGTSLSSSIVPHGKRAIYSLKSWEEDPKPIMEMVVDELRIAQKPLSSTEIAKQIHKKDDTISIKSCTGIIGLMNWDTLLPVVGNKYILADWKSRYRTNTIERNAFYSKQYDRLRIEEAYEIMESLEERPVLQRRFVNLLVGTHGFAPGTANSLCQNESYFLRTRNENNRILLDLKPNLDSTERRSTHQILTEGAIEILNNNQDHEMPLNELVNLIHHKFIPHRARNNVYKILNQEEIFEKEIDSHDKKLIRLKPMTANEIDTIHDISQSKGSTYIWKSIKDILVRELAPVMMHESQPLRKVKIDFQELLELYHRFLTFRTNKPVFDYLALDILVGVQRFFQDGSDYHDARSYHKSIMLTIEAALFKIIYLVKHDEFKRIDLELKSKQYRQGMGRYMKIIDRLDPKKIRLLDPTHDKIPSTNFLRDINRVYWVRNRLAHLGGDYLSSHDWNSSDINRNIKSALIVQIYTVFLYRSELEMYV